MICLNLASCCLALLARAAMVECSDGRLLYRDFVRRIFVGRVDVSDRSRGAPRPPPPPPPPPGPGR